MIKEKSCGAIIINKEDKILTIKHNKGHWAFPKGHVEQGETEVETALREIKEETNLTADIIDNIKEVSTYSPKEEILKDVVYFLGLSNTTDVKLQETEVYEYKWLTYEECLDILTHENDKIILKKIYTKYKSLSNI